MDIPLITRTRRNHALEHATIHLLSQPIPDLNLVGRSDWNGFTLYGAVDTELVLQCATEALDRLRAGESELAIHPRCGTNLATGLVLSSIGSAAVLNNRRRSALSKAAGLALTLGAVLVLTQPLGLKAQQRWTTLADIDALQVTRIERKQQGKLTVHRVHTTQE